eukprot:10138276-Karenia_brevis.AAC.1
MRSAPSAATLFPFLPAGSISTMPAPSAGSSSSTDAGLPNSLVQPPASPPSSSSSLSDSSSDGSQPSIEDEFCEALLTVSSISVSYTHLRAHETLSDL